MQTEQPRRNWVVYVCAIALTAWMGMNSHLHADFFPSFIAEYAGDTLWALAIFATIGLLFRSIPTWQAAAGAFVISSLVEYSQLYHAPWIDSIRGTPLGALALGSEFIATDLGCYAVGVFFGMLIEIWTLD